MSGDRLPCQLDLGKEVKIPMSWTEGDPSKITMFLSTSLQSIESQLPAQSRQGSSSEFLDQQWIQFPGGGGEGAFMGKFSFPLQSSYLLSSSVFAVYFFTLTSRC